eukprot:3935547-Rhodomonas_salina.1
MMHARADQDAWAGPKRAGAGGARVGFCSLRPPERAVLLRETESGQVFQTQDSATQSLNM